MAWLNIYSFTSYHSFSLSPHTTGQRPKESAVTQSLFRHREPLTHESALWDVRLLARYLGCCPGTVYRYANRHGRAYYGAHQPAGRNTEWRFDNPLKAVQNTADST